MMTFSTIIYKNIRHNFTKYLSYYLVNSFIVAVLFMYGSLMFNDVMIKEISGSNLLDVMRTSFFGIVIFSVSFISYTSIYFIKYRGKEFGVYLTLGMTTKDLRKMTFLENIAIAMTSLVSGIIAGLLFSKIFYLVIQKILNLHKDLYYISYKTFLLSTGVFIVVIFLNQIFTNIYILRLSIIEVIKSSSKKEVSKSKPVIGIISLIIFMVALYLLPQTLLKRVFDGDGKVMALCIICSILCPYFIIGSLIELVRSIIKKFPDLYNKNLLVLTNLSHRFFAYKTVLFIVSILAAGAIFFIGLTYSMYASVNEAANKEFPYEFMFIQTKQFNNISPDEVKKVIRNNGGAIKKYSVLECISIPEYREAKGKVEYYSDGSDVISESNYNKHMNTSISVRTGEVIFANVIKENIKRTFDYNTIFTFEKKDKAEKRNRIFDENYQVDTADFYKTIDKAKTYKVSRDKTQQIYDGFEDFTVNEEYYTGEAAIIDDAAYKKALNTIGKDKILRYHLINLKKGNKDKIFKALVECVRKTNTNDDTVWQKNKSNMLNSKATKRSILEAYRPISKYEKIQSDMEKYGFIFFSLLFLGSLFLFASVVVLYYKVITDIEEEKTRFMSINRLGITTAEGVRILVRQLSVIFFVPVIVGGGLGLYYISVLYSNSSLMIFLIGKSLLVLGAYVLLQVIFYFAIRKRYLNDILLN